MDIGVHALTDWNLMPTDTPAEVNNIEISREINQYNMKNTTQLGPTTNLFIPAIVYNRFELSV